LETLLSEGTEVLTVVEAAVSEEDYSIKQARLRLTIALSIRTLRWVAKVALALRLLAQAGEDLGFQVCLIQIVAVLALEDGLTMEVLLVWLGSVGAGAH
jgi:hypothetical protein